MLRIDIFILQNYFKEIKQAKSKKKKLKNSFS